MNSYHESEDANRINTRILKDFSSEVCDPCHLTYAAKSVPCCNT